MTKYLKTADAEWFKLRVAWLMYCALAAFLLLFIRLFYLQIIQGQELRRLSENNCIRLENIDPPRGLIFDRTGSTLVENRPSFDLSIILRDAKPLGRTIEKLAEYMNVPASEILAKTGRGRNVPSYKPILIKQDIGRDVLARIESRKFDLPGVVVNVRIRRHYLNEHSAAHLLGYLSEISAEELRSGKYPGCRGGDFIGKFGVEKAFEPFLRGRRGGRQVEVNASGQVVDVLKTVDALPGHNVFLTTDNRLQQKAESMLKDLVGSVIAMEPGSGQILAMASSPSFDQNDFVNGMSHEQWESLVSNPFRPMQNKVVQSEYPPASTYKIVTAMAGLEEGVIDARTVFHCPGYYTYGDRVFRCWKKEGHGNTDVVGALAQSCDVFFYQVGQRLGVDRLAWYGKACGLGTPTGVNLDDEAAGLVPTAAWKQRRTGVAWQGGETLSIAIGQGYNLVTPLQLMVLSAAVANGGERLNPLILKKIETPEGRIILESQRRVTGRLPAGKSTLDLIKKGLWGVVNDISGTAAIARIPGIEVSGKTGTAQVVGRKDDEEPRDVERSDHLKAHAWFVAYAPSKNPKIAVVVMVEHGGSGSGAAAPIARGLIETYLKEEPAGEKPPVAGPG